MTTKVRQHLQLWQFLLRLLESKNTEHLIEWVDKSQGEFRLKNPDQVSVLWGLHKFRPNMNYDKLSRSMRYYYEKGIILKVPFERYHYRFTNFEELNEYLANLSFAAPESGDQFFESVQEAYLKRPAPQKSKGVKRLGKPLGSTLKTTPKRPINYNQQRDQRTVYVNPMTPLTDIKPIIFSALESSQAQTSPIMSSTGYPYSNSLTVSIDSHFQPSQNPSTTPASRIPPFNYYAQKNSSWEPNTSTGNSTSLSSSDASTSPSLTGSSFYQTSFAATPELYKRYYEPTTANSHYSGASNFDCSIHGYNPSIYGSYSGSNSPRQSVSFSDDSKTSDSSINYNYYNAYSSSPYYMSKTLYHQQLSPESYNYLGNSPQSSLGNYLQLSPTYAPSTNQPAYNYPSSGHYLTQS